MGVSIGQRSQRKDCYSKQPVTITELLFSPERLSFRNNEYRLLLTLSVSPSETKTSSSVCWLTEHSLYETSWWYPTSQKLSISIVHPTVTPMDEMTKITSHFLESGDQRRQTIWAGVLSVLNSDTMCRTWSTRQTLTSSSFPPVARYKPSGENWQHSNSLFVWSRIWTHEIGKSSLWSWQKMESKESWKMKRIIHAKHVGKNTIIHTISHDHCEKVSQ